MGTIEREPEVIDNLTSTSTIDALSANQGKVLNERIDTFVPTPGTFSGNQTLASVQSAVVRTGITQVYMNDTQISGWSLVIAYVSGNSRTIQILGTSCAVRMHTDDGTNWTTSKWGA